MFFRLPEVPPDTAETNPIMRHNEIYNFAQLAPDNIITGCAKMSLDFITKFDDLVESLSGNNPVHHFACWVIWVLLGHIVVCLIFSKLIVI